MAKKLLQLFPPSSEKVELKNLYLYKHGWFANNATQPRVAANFLSSLDGRIAVSPSAQTKTELPKDLTSDEDFRLFLELHAQADCLITHGGYMRALAENKLGNILQIPNNKDYEDLYNWRALQGLNPHPTLVIASSSLEFPMHPSLKEHGQKVYIATSQQSEPSKRKTWEDQGYKVIVAGEKKVDGKPLIDALCKEDLKHFYLIAGPKMLHTMIKDKKLSHLYLSNAQQLLGGEFFNTMLDGEILTTPKLELKSLFYDDNSENGHGLFFSNYDCQYE